jgi:ATP-dependent DNA helicase RecG
MVFSACRTPKWSCWKNTNKAFAPPCSPVYPSTEKLSNKGITNRVINKLIEQLFKETRAQFLETLADELRNALKLISKKEALLNIHFPKNQEMLAKAQYR